MTHHTAEHRSAEMNECIQHCMECAKKDGLPGMPARRAART